MAWTRWRPPARTCVQRQRVALRSPRLQPPVGLWLIFVFQPSGWGNQALHTLNRANRGGSRAKRARNVTVSKVASVALNDFCLATAGGCAEAASTRSSPSATRTLLSALSGALH